MKKSILYIRDNKNHDYRVVANVIEDWEGFEKLAKYLQINWQAKLIDSFDGPDARKWIFLIDKERIELIHSDGYGNYLTSSSNSGESLINKIGKDLEERLKGM